VSGLKINIPQFNSQFIEGKSMVDVGGALVPYNGGFWKKEENVFLLINLQ